MLHTDTGCIPFAKLAGYIVLPSACAGFGSDTGRMSCMTAWLDSMLPLNAV